MGFHQQRSRLPPLGFLFEVFLVETTAATAVHIIYSIATKDTDKGKMTIYRKMEDS